MSDTVITVEGLGKKYRIRHQAERQPYVALRDVVAQKCAAPFRWLAERRSKIEAGSSPRPSPNSQLPRTEDFWALRDVSFRVRRGEVVGIIGRNGAGKSTLLKILSRITEPTEGRVKLRGRVASLLEVGTGFHPELTGRENIFLNGAILGMSRAEIKGKFDEIVAFAEVEKFLDTPVKRYSSGMYVRLAFAVAAHLEPEVLLVDEVLSVGDAAFQEKCVDQMRRIRDSGRTILFISHNMAFVRTLCGRALLLSQGRLLAGGAVNELIREYLAQGVHASADQSPIVENGLQLVSVKVNGCEGNDIEDIPLGDPFQIVVQLKAHQRVEGARFQLQFYDGTETRAAEIASREAGPGSLTLDGQLELRFEVLHNALVPDRYRVDFQIKGPSVPQVLLHAPSLCPFRIAERILPGAWGPYTRVHGAVYLQSRVQVVPQPKA